MFYYNLKDISEDKFVPYEFNIRRCRRIEKNKIKVRVDTKKNNFRDTLNTLHKILPDIYQKVSVKDLEKKDYLMNNNRGDFLVWYIDGSEEFTLKGNLQYNSKYSISEKDFEEDGLFISKPTHPYIGSGRYIKIGSYKEVKERDKVKFMGQYLDFVVQPLISKKLRFWEGYRKFDIRLYAAIYTNKDKEFEYYSHPYGVARLALNKYNPREDYSSVVTNISVQESLPEYTTSGTLKLVKDDIGIGKKILLDLKKKDFLKKDFSKKNQILILGLDVLLLNDKSFRIIEINQDPYIFGEENMDNMETTACLTFIMKLFGNIIPEMKYLR